MPTYEYFCSSCDKISEIFHSIKLDAMKKCPECGANSLTRLISGGGAVIVRGTQTPCRGGRVDGKIKEQKQERANKIKTQKKVAQKMLAENPPWWRPNPDKINFDVLKNPKKYIETGEVD